MPNRRHLAAVVLALLVGAAVVIVPDIGSAPPDTAKPAAATERSTAPPEPRRAPRRPPPPPATLVYEVETSDPVVFLTIDDGAVRDPALVTELKRNGIPPTLFLRTYADQDPAYFRRLRDRTGGWIQNHSATHANLLGRALAAQRAEIGPVSDHYAEVFGERPTLFRAPYGNSDATTLRAAADAGAKPRLPEVRSPCPHDAR